MEKMTNVKALEMVLGMNEVLQNSELVEKLTKMKVQFEKKNKGVSANGKKTLTKEQQANEKIKEVILEILKKCTEPKAIKELQAENKALIGVEKYSNQKISALMKQLISVGLVERVEEKKVAKFKIIEKVELTETKEEVKAPTKKKEEVKKKTKKSKSSALKEEKIEVSEVDNLVK